MRLGSRSLLTSPADILMLVHIVRRWGSAPVRTRLRMGGGVCMRGPWRQPRIILDRQFVPRLGARPPMGDQHSQGHEIFRYRGLWKLFINKSCAVNGVVPVLGAYPRAKVQHQVGYRRISRGRGETAGGVRVWGWPSHFCPRWHDEPASRGLITAMGRE